MERPAVYRPNLPATLVALGLLPGLALVLAVAGIVVIAREGVVAGVLMIGLSLLAGYPALIMLRGWFSIRVDAEALSIVGLFGVWRARMPWKDLELVGLVPAGMGMSQEMRKLKEAGSTMFDAPVLAVRPIRERSKAPWWALRWDDDHRLLLIAGLDKWTAPSAEIIDSVRRNAGPTWHEDPRAA